MKYVFTLLIAGLFTCSLAAQNSTISATETLSDAGYEFKVKVSKNRKEALQLAYNELTGQPKDRRISGVAFQEADGITITLNTRKKYLSIVTDVKSGLVVEDAKAKARIVKQIMKAAQEKKKSWG